MQSRRKKSTLLSFRSPTTPRIRRKRRKRRRARKKKYQTSSEESSSSVEQRLEKISPYKRQKLEHAKIIRHQKWLDSLFIKADQKIQKTESEIFKDKVFFSFKCFGYLTNLVLLLYLTVG